LSAGSSPACTEFDQAAEIEVSAIKRADRLALHVHEAEADPCERARSPARQGGQRAGWSDRGIDFDKLPTIPDLITGRAQGQSDGEVTCFLNNIGLGYQFAAAGRWSTARPRAAGSA